MSNQSVSQRRLGWTLLLALYGTFLWRSVYSLRIFSLGLLDWVIPVLGLGLWLVVGWRRKRPWPRTALDLPLLAWLAVILLTSVSSVNLRASLVGMWEALIASLILWLLVDATRRGWSSALWRALYLVGATVCVLGAAELLAWYFGWPLLPQFQQGWPAIGGLADPVPPIIHRIGFALVNITALSGFVAMLIPPAVAVLLSTRNRDTRVGMALWLLAAGATILLSLSRGGFLALSVSLPLLFLGATRDPRLRRIWSRLRLGRSRLLLVGSGVLAVALVAGAGFLAASRLGEHGSGDAVRMDLWRSAGTMLANQPLVGVGPAAYGTALRAYRDPSLARDHITTAHNLYLNTAAEMGVPGLLALAWIVSALVWVWWRRWRSLDPGSSAWWQFLGIGAALAGLAAQSLVDTFLESAIILAVAFFLAQILASPGSEPQREVRPRRWPWAVALALLVAGAAGQAWDARGHALFERSLTSTRTRAVDNALAAAQLARDYDPWMPLYTCHVGYLYGLKADTGDAQALVNAISEYRLCVSDTEQPDWMDPLNLAALLWQVGQRQEASALVQEATTATPSQWLAWLSRGLWAEKAGAEQEAVIAYKRVLELDPELAGSPFWQQGERASRWDEILAGGEEAWRWQVLVASQQWEQVLQETAAWLSEHPNDPEALAWQGESLVGLGRPQEALDLLNRSLDMMPARARSYLARGEAHLAVGDDGQAERDFRTALFLEPDARAHLLLARLARNRGLFADALEHYARALSSTTLSQSTYVVLYHRMGWPAPLPQVTRIATRSDQQAALEWGELLEEEGDWSMARTVYESALSMDPTFTEVRQRLDGLGSR